jgi:hypothetical protein
VLTAWCHVVIAGAVGGAIWHGIKGARNAPKGHRIKDSFAAVRLRAPVLGGNFGVWGGVFSVYDCSLAYIRRTEDPWNAIMAGAATGGTLAARGALFVVCLHVMFPALRSDARCCLLCASLRVSPRQFASLIVSLSSSLLVSAWLRRGCVIASRRRCGCSQSLDESRMIDL